MSSLDFIKDEDLRKRIDVAIEFIYALHKASKTDERNQAYQEEMCRVIILYIISTIEAVLLYFYQVRGAQIMKTEYRHVQPLPPEFVHAKKSQGRVVVAVQEQIPKQEHELGLHGLVTYFQEQGLLLPETSEKILGFNAIRNTMHLGKKREDVCDLTQVEHALALLVLVLEKAPASWRNK